MSGDTPVALALQWRPAGLTDVDELMAIEVRAYSHPWSRGNLVDSVSAGHWLWRADGPDGALVAYWVAMPVLDELHLLNLTVEPALQGRGLGQEALGHLHAQAEAAGLPDIWLEVRESNVRAQRLYERAGYAVVGRRRGYYPAAPLAREDALLMRRQREPA